jgi:hypothetical protein
MFALPYNGIIGLLTSRLFRRAHTSTKFIGRRLWQRRQAVGKQAQGGPDMGKYVLAWILGVPAFVLVIVHFFAH